MHFGNIIHTNAFNSTHLARATIRWQMHSSGNSNFNRTEPFPTLYTLYYIVCKVHGSKIRKKKKTELNTISALFRRESADTADVDAFIKNDETEAIEIEPILLL